MNRYILYRESRSPHPSFLGLVTFESLIRKGIGVHGAAHIVIRKMSIYFRGGCAGVSENFFQDKSIGVSVLIHKRCGGVAQLMHGKTADRSP